jgi:Zn finger protein HypA/HybF involved in hydrogenase expression
MELRNRDNLRNTTVGQIHFVVVVVGKLFTVEKNYVSFNFVLKIKWFVGVGREMKKKLNKE